ncbi:hypothetical protein MRX96_002118 [Rhipicephalus microplus]
MLKERVRPLHEGGTFAADRRGADAVTLVPSPMEEMQRGDNEGAPCPLTPTSPSLLHRSNAPSPRSWQRRRTRKKEKKQKTLMAESP